MEGKNTNAVANDGKSLGIEVDGVWYDRYPVKTHVITDQDTLSAVLETYAKPLIQQGDIVFVSEKAVSCTQRRAIRMKDIHPRRLAKVLSRFVYKTPYGIGLGIPETMEMALRECGVIRILFAAFIGVIGKLFGRRGWFYNIAGDKARSIDGPCDYTLPPYNEYVVLGPLDPDNTAVESAKAAGCPLVAIVDINDLGGNILGISDSAIDREWLARALKDNPLGQTNEQTPLGILRKRAVAPTTQPEMKINLYALTLDCKDPHKLAKFYAALLQWEIPFYDEEYACVGAPGTKQGAYPGITFQRNAEYQPPVWPAEPEAQQQMAHIDFAVNDLEKAVEHAIQCGAVIAEKQFSDNWTVMLDPSGHPFCLCQLKHIF